MSLRLRLTLLYSAILALTLVGFSITLYLTLEAVTFGIVKDSLRDEANAAAKSARNLPDYIALPRKLASAQTYAQMCSYDGKVLHRSDNLIRLDTELPALKPAHLQQVQQGNSVFDFVAVDDGRLLTYNVPVKEKYADNIVGFVQFARSVGDEDQRLSTVQQLLLIGGSVVTLVAFGVGWVLSGTALRPINRLTQTAHAIGVERDFSQRVSYTGPTDEVGRLAATFNTMLEALQAAYLQEAQALQAQRRFVADASHELRTPLTTIRGNLGLLQRDPPINPGDRDAAVNDMVDESERMSRLVGDLLTLARADAGRPLRSEVVPIIPLIEDVCRKAGALAPDQTVDCSAILPATVLGDSDALKQVLLILLDNALKFTPPSGTISLTATASDGQVAIGIRDTGPGIPPTVLPLIFERFYRGDAARSGNGSGLGLAIARSLVEAMHGTLTVESTVGQGSVFTVTLARKEEG